MTQPEETSQQPNLQTQQSSAFGLSRRQFMGMSAATLAVLALPKSVLAETATNNTTAPALTPPSDLHFYQPNIITSQLNTGDDYNTLNSTLDVIPKPYSDVGATGTYIHAFQQVEPTPPAPSASTPTFIPGPTLCVYPGDLIQLQVNNTLTSDYSDTHETDDPNTPHDFNTTNMHFHGLHVSPMSQTQGGNVVSAGDGNLEEIKFSSDDVLYSLEPQHSHKYCVWLPAFHAPGTHWYHSHRHGATAIQVAGGMVGALIVKEPPGQEICPGAPDVVMVVEEEAQSTTGQGSDQANLDLGIYYRRGNTQPGTFLVNGHDNPNLYLKKGEIQRWRLINANSTPRAFMKLELRAGTESTGTLQTVYCIAVDGITLYGKSMNDSAVKVTNPVPFAPGNRFDFLVNLPPGIYTLWKSKDTDVLPRGLKSPTEPLATIHVDESETFADADLVAASFQTLMSGGIPTTGMPDYLKPIDTVDQENPTPVVFQASFNDGSPNTGFRVTNSKYQPTLINIDADLNSSQEWIVANTEGGAAHPFHIHVNPFLVVATATIDSDTKTQINALGSDSTAQEQIHDLLAGLNWTEEGIDPTVWWDTFTIPAGKAYKIRQRFDDYWGNYVLHCHVLIHEDQGMMWNVKVNNVEDKGANPCQQLLTPVVLAGTGGGTGNNSIFKTGTKIALQADTGKWMSRCNGCQRTVSDNPDTVTVHIENPQTKPYGQFEVVDVGGGKIALKADNGKYVARCNGCVVGASYPDALTIHVNDSSAPYAQFTPERLANGKYALKADTGKYVSRCNNCVVGAAYSDTVTVHVTDPSNAPYAQWNIVVM